MVIALRKHYEEVSSTTTEDPVRPRFRCAIQAAVEADGDYWSMLVLGNTSSGAPPSLPRAAHRVSIGIASNMLDHRWKRLVAAGILVRDDNPAALRRE